MSNSQTIKIPTIYGDMEIKFEVSFPSPPNNDSQLIRRGRGRPRKQIVNIIESAPAPIPESIPEAPAPAPAPISVMTIDDLQSDDDPLIIPKRKRGRPIGSLSCKTRFNNLFMDRHN
ncbi:MAG: hypothetical protein WCJ33_04430 [Pseudomonadota bacterium]